MWGRWPAVAVLLAVGCGGGATTGRAGRVEPLSREAYAHYLRGRIAIYEGDYDGAWIELERATLAAPFEAPIAVAFADALYRAGDRARALREIERAQTVWPDHAGVWLVSGRIYRGTARHADATRALERAIDLDPDAEAAYLALAATWLTLDQPGRAEAAYRRLLRRDPDSLAANYRLGLRLLDHGDAAAAARLLERAIEIDPDHLKSRLALSRAQRALGHARRAIHTLRDAFDRSGGDPRLGETLVVSLLELGDRVQAVDLLRTLDRPDLTPAVRLSLGQLFLQVGEASGALDVADSLLAIYPDSDRARTLRGRALLALKRPAEAVAALLEIAADSPAHAEARATAAETLVRAGDARRAREIVDGALAAHPASADLAIASSLIHELSGDGATARRTLEAAVAAAPRDAELLYALGSLEDRLGQPDRAIEVIQQILDRDPDHVSALNFIGFSLADRLVDLARADELLRRASRLEPANGYVLDSLGWLRFRQRRLRDAEKLCARARRLVPTEPEIVWHLAEIARAQGDRRRAVALMRRARRMEPEPALAARIDARLRELSRQDPGAAQQ